MVARPGVEALLFDLGGVLIETDWNRAIKAWAADGGVAPLELSQRFHRDEAFRAHECGTIEDQEYFASLCRSLGVELSDAQWLAGWNAILGEPVLGMAGALQELAGALPVYVFSNTNKAHVTHWKPRYGALLAPVREIICSCEIGLRKPDTEAFLAVARRIGVASHRIAFFDDLEENVVGARKAGLRAYQVASLADLRKAAADLGLRISGNS